MLKAKTMVLMLGLVSGGAGIARGWVAAAEPDQTIEQAPKQAGPASRLIARADAARMEMQRIKRANPEFFAFEDKIARIDRQIEGVTRRLIRGEIDKDDARGALVLLIVEKQQVQSDPEYLADQKLVELYMSYVRRQPAPKVRIPTREDAPALTTAAAEASSRTASRL